MDTGGTMKDEPSAPPPPPPVPAPGSPGEARREGVDRRGVSASVEPWDPSVNGVPRPFFSNRSLHQC